MQRLISQAKIFYKKIKIYKNFRVKRYKNTLLKILNKKNGLEIGGPSSIFQDHKLLPVYPVVKSLDGCNFNCETVWEGKVKEGAGNYKYRKTSPPGHQYICEVSNLQPIESGKYDFVLCSHVLEHSANPLKAIEEMVRVLKADGVILIVLPDPRQTFDHNRQVTDFSHLVSDYKNNTREDDLTHLDEILRLHDLSLDLPAGTPAQFGERSRANYKNRCFHQHVFNYGTMEKIAKYFNLDILFLGGAAPFHMIMVLKKSSRTTE